MDDEYKGFWLDKDDEWRKARTHVDADSASKQYQQPVLDQKKIEEPNNKLNLALNITVPRLSILSRKQLLIGLIPVAALIMGVVGFRILTGTIGKSDDKSAVLSYNGVNPDFEVLLPNNKKENIASDRILYDPNLKVASFTDKIGHVDITVSQQPLPESYRNDPDTDVEKLAQYYGATEVIYESSPKAYLETSKKGQQSVIFHKSGSLIFINANSEIDKELWAAYITTLL